jgi:hypothetical protein
MFSQIQVSSIVIEQLSPFTINGVAFLLFGLRLILPNITGKGKK